MADKEFCGKPYRQITRGLRIHRGPGRGETVSIRPHRGNARDGTLVYLDSDAAPTLVTFDEYDIVDVVSLLKLGAIAEYAPSQKDAPPKPAKAASIKEVQSGETRGL